jgi:hypothetical protein
VHFEHAMYEGFAPHRVPVMVECLTDNVNCAASEMRVLFRKGQLGTSGSVSDLDLVSRALPARYFSGHTIISIGTLTSNTMKDSGRPRRQ